MTRTPSTSRRMPGATSRASTRHTDTNEPDPEWNHGYGYQVWLSREGYRLDGAYGQYALVFPDYETVIAITSAQPVTSQPMLDLVWEHLVAGLGQPSSTEREGRLAS